MRRFDNDQSPPPPLQLEQGALLSPASQVNGWLQSLLVLGGGNWTFDLSSQFLPNVSEYGVIVPADFDNATLCVQPYQGKTLKLNPKGYRTLLQTATHRTFWLLSSGVVTANPVAGDCHQKNKINASVYWISSPTLCIGKDMRMRSQSCKFLGLLLKKY